MGVSVLSFLSVGLALEQALKVQLKGVFIGENCGSSISWRKLYCIYARGVPTI